MARGPERSHINERLAAIDARVERGELLTRVCGDEAVPLSTYYRWRAATLGDGARHAEKKRLRTVILQAAKTVFLRDGYAANLGAIAEEAGVARQTLYNQFGNKEQLFRAVVRSVFERMLRPILHIDPAGDLRQTLLAYARQYLEVVFDADGLALHRLAIAEQREFPDLPGIVHAMGSGEADAVLAAYLKSQMEAGRIVSVDPILAAESFLGSLVGHRRSRAMVGLDFMSVETRFAMAQIAVETFARGMARDEASDGMAVRQGAARQ